jgi:hypothetical protein
MTDDERQAALAAAYARPLEDPIARWRREGEAIKAAREQGRAELRQREREILAERAADWYETIDQRIAAALAEYEAVATEGTGMALGQIRAELREEIVAAVGELRAELAVMRAAEKAEVITLPALPLRKRSDAA